MAIDQGESWINLAGNGTIDSNTKFPIIGQIFFRTNETALDEDDLYQVEMLTVGIKEYLGAVVGLHRLRPFTFGFIGWADYRGAAAYNQNLSANRADMVKSAFDPHFAGDPTWRHYYTSLSIGAGEGKEKIAASLHKDRRVDIVCSRTFEQKKSIDFPDTKIIVSPVDPDLSRDFSIRTLIGISGEIPFTPIGAAVLYIEIRNDRNGKTIQLMHSGPGGSAGLPVGANRPTDFQHFRTPYYLKLVDFIGEGEISGASAGFAGSNNLMFRGPLVYGRAPKEDVLLKKPLVVKTDGWDLNVGVGGVTGDWEKLPPGFWPF